jgi:hypothetical protein
MIYKPMTTERFVQLAKAIHGDLYDYSDTVYESSQRPVAFGCNRCGMTVRLSQAQSHLRARKPCGCKPCRMEKLNRCGSCNKQVSSKSFNYSAKKCDSCVELGKSARRKATVEKHSKQCKGCNALFSHRHKAYCSEECRKDSVRNRMVYTCSYCEKSVRKRTVSTARFQFCDKQCQDAYQGSVGYDRCRIVYSWTIRSKVAKKKYESESEKRRKMQSEPFQWWRLCKSEASKVKSLKADGWDRRCNSAASLMRKRFEPIFRLSGKKIWDWDSKISRERIARLRVSNITTEDLKWNNRIQQASKNARNRLALRG